MKMILTKRAIFFVGLVICLVGVIPMAKGATPSECKQQKNNLLGNCKSAAILGTTPSATCCQHVRATEVECACPFVTPKTASILGGHIKRVVGQIEHCGRTVPRNFKCGSITTPP